MKKKIKFFLNRSNINIRTNTRPGYNNRLTILESLQAHPEVTPRLERKHSRRIGLSAIKAPVDRGRATPQGSV